MPRSLTERQRNANIETTLADTGNFYLHINHRNLPTKGESVMVTKSIKDKLQIDIYFDYR
jgi:hypothetical protein